VDAIPGPVIAAGFLRYNGSAIKISNITYISESAREDMEQAVYVHQRYGPHMYIPGMTLTGILRLFGGDPY
jgi:hypothetical protein